MKNIVIILTFLILTSCSAGFRYEIVENSDEYLLKGKFYNNHPFIKIKPRLPNSYIVKKKSNHIATKEDIKSTGLREEKIVDGYIIDRENEIEIRLLVFDPRAGEIRTAYENGCRKIASRKQTEDINAYIREHEEWIDKKINP